MAVIRLGTIERFMGTEAERLAMDVTRVKAGSTFLEDTGFLHVLDGAGNWILKKSASQLTGSSVTVSATQTRPDNATPYTALDVVGTNPATNMTFATGLTAGAGFVVYGARLRIDVAAIPAGMASFRLHLFNAAPTAIADNVAFNLIAADRAKYLGYVEISGVLDVGDTLFAEVDNINFTGKLATASLFGVLQTVGAYTPTAQAVKTVTLIMSEL